MTCLLLHLKTYLYLISGQIHANEAELLRETKDDEEEQMLNLNIKHFGDFLKFIFQIKGNKSAA